MKKEKEKKPFDVRFSGTTGAVVVLVQQTLYSANVGDSRAVLAKRMGQWDYLAVPLTCDHKPSRPDEKRRIVSRGGRVGPRKHPNGHAVGSSRVWLADQDIPGLAVSRAIGDSVAASVGVTCEPEVWQRQIESNDAFIILASDGVWEFMTPQEAVDLVAEFDLTDGGAKPNKDKQDVEDQGADGKTTEKQRTIEGESEEAAAAAEEEESGVKAAAAALVTEAQKRWAANDEDSRDDITVVIIPLDAAVQFKFQ